MTGDHARQLPLALPHRAAMGRADFLSGPGNAEALQLIDRWPDWPERGVLVTGPIGSGKTHLAEIWRAASGGAWFHAGDLDEAAVAGLSADAVVIEDIDRGLRDEAALFHLFNLVGERRIRLLATSRLPPAALAIGLPDLASRVRAAHPVSIAEPDDDLLRRVLVKLFADRQLAVDQTVVDYIAVRIERSLGAARAVVDELDRLALAAGRALTRPFVADAIGRILPGGAVSSADGSD